jgi:hypothetical protein
VAEDRIRRTPQQEQGVQQEGAVLGETRKGLFVQPEIALPPGFVLPSLTVEPPRVEQTSTPPTSGQQAQSQEN